MMAEVAAVAEDWFEVVRQRPVRAKFLGETDSDRPFDQAVSGYLVEVEPGVCRHFSKEAFWQEWRRFDGAERPPAPTAAQTAVPAANMQQLAGAMLKLMASIMAIEHKKLADRLAQVLHVEVGQHAQQVDCMLAAMASLQQAAPVPPSEPPAPQ